MYITVNLSFLYFVYVSNFLLYLLPWRGSVHIRYVQRRKFMPEKFVGLLAYDRQQIY